jgi:hypothetical protein
MTTYPAGEITCNGVTVSVFTENGKWAADHAGATWRTDTWDQLVHKIGSATRKTTKKVAVPVTQVTPEGVLGIKFRRGTATGIHGSNGNVLVTWHMLHGDVKDQISRWGSSEVFFGEVTDDVLEKFHTLVKAAAEAEEARHAFQSQHKINLLETVERAIDQDRTEA